MAPVNQKRDEDAMWRIRHNQLVADEREKRHNYGRRKQKEVLSRTNETYDQASCSLMIPAKGLKTAERWSDEEQVEGDGMI